MVSVDVPQGNTMYTALIFVGKSQPKFEQMIEEVLKGDSGADQEILKMLKAQCLVIETDSASTLLEALREQLYTFAEERWPITLIAHDVTSAGLLARDSKEQIIQPSGLKLAYLTVEKLQNPATRDVILTALQAFCTHEI